jgi:1-pyrroline-5-carboxylate dehydrogenase
MSLMANFSGARHVPLPQNEPNLTYAPGTAERAVLKARLHEMAGERIEIPVVVGGREMRTGHTSTAVMPHQHAHVLADWHHAGRQEVELAITSALDARHEWASWPWEDRAAVFLRAAELLTTSWRQTLNAATMLGQSKTAFQAEIDSASELIDFWRFNAAFAQELYEEQPLSSHAVWNQLDYRGLEGFVYAVTPFNFTAIAGNLPSAPALMGCTVVWKPAASAMLSAHYILKLLEAAGLPPGVINLVPGDPAEISDVVLDHPEFAGLHFTGSTAVFKSLWQRMATRLGTYRSYPRIVGETGGKDFVVVHPSADPQAAAVGLVRGAFEYQGQKCSAASRAYVPASLWPTIKERALAMLADIKMGDVRDFRNFMSAVIDEKSFKKISGYLDDAKANATILAGGTADGREGYFVAPTIVQASHPDYRLMCEEIFGPVLTVYVYSDAEWSSLLQTVDRTSPYALTGCVFARDRSAIREAMTALRESAGNFYVNDKPTGAVVGQQPFGGARASGTNDKAGSKMNLLRWVSARSVKETFSPPRDYSYPFMAEE